MPTKKFAVLRGGIIHDGQIDDIQEYMEYVLDGFDEMHNWGVAVYDIRVNNNGTVEGFEHTKITVLLNEITFPSEQVLAANHIERIVHDKEGVRISNFNFR